MRFSSYLKLNNVCFFVIAGSFWLMYCEKYVMGFVYLTGDYDNASGFLVESGII